MSQNDQKIETRPASSRAWAASRISVVQFSPVFNRIVFCRLAAEAGQTMRRLISPALPYIRSKRMHAVIETPSYLADAKAAGVSENELNAIVNVIASDPFAGDIIPGSGGARKVRVAGKGKGKRGGYRAISYYAAEDVPVFLLALVSKGQRDDISQADRNALRVELSTVADNYRAGVRAKLAR